MLYGAAVLVVVGSGRVACAGTCRRASQASSCARRPAATWWPPRWGGGCNDAPHGACQCVPEDLAQGLSAAVDAVRVFQKSCRGVGDGLVIPVACAGSELGVRPLNLLVQHHCSRRQPSSQCPPRQSPPVLAVSVRPLCQRHPVYPLSASSFVCRVQLHSPSSCSLRAASRLPSGNLRSCISTVYHPQRYLHVCNLEIACNRKSNLGFSAVAIHRRPTFDPSQLQLSDPILLQSHALDTRRSYRRARKLSAWPPPVPFEITRPR
jgi:hypothetical protein